jgi:cytochrome b
LIVIRNVAVFVPVALTWSAVSHATAGFAKFVNENPNAVANFLEFWQNGYGYLSSEWTIGTVANLDFLIILVVIVLTLYISLATNKDKQRRSIRSESFNLERLALALEVRDFLHDKRRVTNVTMNQSMATAIQNLQNATYELDLVAQRISHEQR